MNKLTILFLTMLLTCLPMAMRADSHKEKRDDTRYLAGAVPVVDGKVVFSKEFQIPGMSQKQDRKSTRLNSSHKVQSRMPSSA